MTEVMVDILGRATCTYNVDSNTLDRQSTLAVKVVLISADAGGYIWFEGFALKWGKMDRVGLPRSPHT